MPTALIVTAILSLYAFAKADALPNESLNGSAHLSRIRHEQNILPDRKNAGFGSLLYDEHGELVLHGHHKTWLYTTALYQAAIGGRRDWYGKWVSYVREFEVDTHVSGPKKIALGLAGQDRWAVIHDVLEVSEHFSWHFIRPMARSGRP